MRFSRTANLGLDRKLLSDGWTFSKRKVVSFVALQL